MKATAKASHEPVDHSALIDIVAVSKILRVSTRQVEHLCAAGKCPPMLRIGTRRRWDASVLRDWIAAGAPQDVAAWLGSRENKPHHLADPSQN